MHRRLRYTLAALALTVGATVTALTGVLDDVLTPADTAWGSPILETSVDVDTTIVTPLDTAWG
ncbi:hypothetical protein [Streptomyces bottropensis]|uniref:hypothetical protein n=1 Tax=Streptomyces bottropensis TaxID=42235 RepID=UPI0036CF1EB4